MTHLHLDLRGVSLEHREVQAFIAQCDRRLSQQREGDHFNVRRLHARLPVDAHLAVDHQTEERVLRFYGHNALANFSGPCGGADRPNLSLIERFGHPNLSSVSHQGEDAESPEGSPNPPATTREAAQ